MKKELCFSGIEKLSLVDYDGVTASTLFLAGCNLRCPFCQNSTLVKGEDLPVITESEVFEYLSKRRGLIDAVVITGGEPTLYDNLPQFIYKIRQFGFLCKLDTNGTNPEMLKLIMREGIDYIAMDIKNSREKYDITAGAKVDIKKVEKSAELLLSRGHSYEFRTTLIKQHHEESDIISISQWLKGAEKYALQKFVDNGGCFESGLTGVPKDAAKEYQSILSSKIKEVILRGYE